MSKTVHRVRTGLPAVRPRLCPAVFDDYQGITALQARNGLLTKPREEWIQIWTQNPAYVRAGGNLPIGWTLQLDGGQIVGFIGCIPVDFHFQGRLLRGAVSHSWVTDPVHRGYSLLLHHRFLSQDNVDLFITDTVSSHAEPALRSMGWSRVPNGRWDRAYFWITNYGGFAKSVLGQKRIVPALVWKSVGLALACTDNLRRPSVRITNPECEPEWCCSFDARFDLFWRELKIQRKNVLISSRTRDALDWRFRNLLSKREAWVVVIPHRSRLSGYAIFDRQDSVRLGLTRIRLIDFQALDNSAASLRTLLSWMLQKCRIDGMDVLESPESLLEPLGPAQSVAPHCRDLDAWRYYYKVNDDAELAQALTEPGAWAPSLYDGDTSL